MPGLQAKASTIAVAIPSARKAEYEMGKDMGSVCSAAAFPFGALVNQENLWILYVVRNAARVFFFCQPQGIAVYWMREILTEDNASLHSPEWSAAERRSK